jgi:hypothetical protein
MSRRALSSPSHRSKRAAESIDGKSPLQMTLLCQHEDTYLSFMQMITGNAAG